PDPRTAAIEAAAEARAGLERSHADLAVVFTAGIHLADPERTLDGVREALEPDVLIGCGAGGVLAGSHEVESGTGIAVWAAALDGGGAVGVRLDGVEMLPCVSQGAAPFGPELTITAAEGNVIHELAGRPAIHKLREVVEDLPTHVQAILANDLLVGIVV